MNVMMFDVVVVMVWCGDSEMVVIESCDVACVGVFNVGRCSACYEA